MPPPLRSYVFDGSTNKKYHKHLSRSATHSADKSAVGSVRQFDKRALETKWQSLNTAVGLLSRSRWFCILQYSFKREQSWLSKATALQDVGISIKQNWLFRRARAAGQAQSTCKFPFRHHDPCEKVWHIFKKVLHSWIPTWNCRLFLRAPNLTPWYGLEWI